tara:strand:- start:98 stop:238 length:141 start_codon:yes stop_codon:yes gene_type:complete
MKIEYNFGIEIRKFDLSTKCSRGPKENSQSKAPRIRSNYIFIILDT